MELKVEWINHAKQSKLDRPKLFRVVEILNIDWVPEVEEDLIIERVKERISKDKSIPFDKIEIKKILEYMPEETNK